MAGPPSGFAQQLRSLRQAQGLTVRALAELVGVSKVTIWKWEKGDVQPRARMLAPLAKALRIAPNALQTSEDVESVESSFADNATPMDTSHHGETLPEVVAKAKQMLAEASGVNPQNITISIEY